MSNQRAVVATFFIALLVGFQPAVSATPVRLVVPYSPGSQTDVLARTLTEVLSAKIGAPVYVETVNAAAGLVGTAQVSRANGDGSTIGLIAVNHVLNPSLVKEVPFDTIKGVRPIAIVGTSFIALVVRQDVPASTVAELVKVLREKGTPYREGITFGTMGHLAGSLFKKTNGLPDEPVAYRTGGQLVMDLLAGNVHWAFVPLPLASAHLRSGKLKAIAVTNEQRSIQHPDIPTFGEQGVKQFVFENWFMFIGPSAMSASTALRYNAYIRTVLQSEAVKASLRQQDILITDRPFAGLEDYMTSEMNRFQRIVTEGNIKLRD